MKKLRKNIGNNKLCSFINYEKSHIKSLVPLTTRRPGFFYGRITMSAPNLIGTLSHLHSPFLL